MSDAGTAKFNHNIQLNSAGAYISLDNNDNSRIAGDADSIDFNLWDNSSAYQTRMTILDTGDVGIGTTSPSHTLHVVDSGNGEIKAERTSGAAVLIQAQSANGKIGTSSNHNLGLNTNGTTRLTLDTSGNCGINTTSPTAKLDVRGSSNSEVAVFTGGTNSGRGLSIQTTSSSGQNDAAVIYDAQDTENTVYGQHIFKTAGVTRQTIEERLVKLAPSINIGSIRNDGTSVGTSATNVLNMGSLVTSGDIGKGRYLITVCAASGTVGTAATGIFGLASSGAIYLYETVNSNSVTLGTSGGNVTAAVSSGSYTMHAVAIPLSVDN